MCGGLLHRDPGQDSQVLICDVLWSEALYKQPPFSGLVLQSLSSAQCSCSFSFFLLSRGQGKMFIFREIGITDLNQSGDMSSYLLVNNSFTQKHNLHSSNVNSVGVVMTRVKIRDQDIRDQQRFWSQDPLKFCSISCCYSPQWTAQQAQWWENCRPFWPTLPCTAGHNGVNYCGGERLSIWLEENWVHQCSILFRASGTQYYVSLRV